MTPKKYVVAIIDDQVYSPQMIMDFLKLDHPEISVRVFSNGRALMKALCANETIHIALVDGKLSNGYMGPEYAFYVRYEFGIPVIGFSVDSQLEKAFTEKGDIQFISKGASLEEIEKLILTKLGII